MGSPLKSLTAVLNLAPSNIDATTTVFPSISSDSIARRLDLEVEAERRGKENLPQTDAADLDVVESRIIDEVSDVRRVGLTAYESEMRVYADRMNGLDVEGKVSEIDVSISNGISALRERVHIGTDHLYLQGERLKLLREELERFRDRHRLDRTAHLPTAAKRHVMRAIIFLMLAAESIINGSFFMESNELGLIGGVFTACTIAAVNIFFSFLFGRMTVQVNHRNLIRKAVGAIIFLAFLVFAIGFNLFVAHFREVAGLVNWEAATRQAAGQFWADPVGLTIFNSWILVLVGFAFATVAWIEGYGWDDPYPGFGDVWRRWERSIADYAHEKESLLEELRDTKDEVLETIKGARADIASRIRNYIQASDYRDHLRLALPVFLEQTQQAASALIGRYRETNTRHRSSPAPAYFARPVSLSKVEPVAGEAEASTRRAELGNLTERADAILSDRTAELLAEFESTFGEYERISRFARGLSAGGLNDGRETPSPAKKT
ncbi:hypothetical protein QFZ27_004856 [Inquilinus ginsengisoli]|uniref:hypothetical protein n=1 Tax=Inquilinus ginsengisoli TaxID=363840 RepID=UPI003D241A32